MTTKQKVRVARKFARRMLQEEEGINTEMKMMGAPSECWDLIIPGLQRRIEGMFQKLGLTSSDWDYEMKLYIRQEGAYAPYQEAPLAYYEWMELEGLLGAYSG